MIQCHHGYYVVEGGGTYPYGCLIPIYCPSCASKDAEISDAAALAYNLDPDRTEPSEMGLCEQISHLGEHITRLRSLAARAEDVERIAKAIKTREMPVGSGNNWQTR